jgi:hypothetical protein
MKSSLKYLFIAVICLPVFFLNIKSSHDWGDDFAQYIHQAKNIIEHIPQSETGYIYNKEFFIGPPAYPIGFPLLLSPVYAVFGNNIHIFNLYISAFLFLLAMLMFHFLRQNFNTLIAALIVLIYIYNPSTLNCKTEIMSDIPFAFFLLLCIVLFQSFKPFNILKSCVLSALVALLISIRNVGLVFVMAVIMDMLFQLIKDRKEIRQRNYNYQNIIYCVIIAVGGFIGYMFLNKFLFNIGGEGLFSYSYFSDFAQLKHTILNNLNYNLIQLRIYFEQFNDEWNFLSVVIGAFFFTFTILGMFKKMMEKLGFIELVVLFYFVAIVLFPFSNYGFRFLIPMFTFLFYFFILGIKSLEINWRINKNILVVLIAILVLFSYKTGISNIFQNQSFITAGPQEEESQDVFAFINNNTPNDARFNFVKPRALALYSNRSAMCNPRSSSESDINQSMIDNNISYFLISNDISFDSTKAFVKNPAYRMKEIWSNNKFTLYKRP